VRGRETLPWRRVLGRDRCGIGVDLCGENKRRPAWTAPVSVCQEEEEEEEARRRGSQKPRDGQDRQDTGDPGRNRSGVTGHSHSLGLV